MEWAKEAGLGKSGGQPHTILEFYGIPILAELYFTNLSELSDSDRCTALRFYLSYTSINYQG